MKNSYKESLKEYNNHQETLLEKFQKQHHEQLEYLEKNLEKYHKEFDLDLVKYITIIALQNDALKDILKLNKIDLLMNKHKKIAKENIKELATDKKVYELAPKKE